MDPAEQERLERNVLEIMQTWERPILLEMNLTQTVGLIGAVQLALRHPAANESPSLIQTRRLIEEFIYQLDPEFGDLYKVLMLGFNKDFDVEIIEVHPTDQ